MKIDWNKGENGLLPVIIQDINTKDVLMLGYMNEEALQQSQAQQRVTFFSRSKNRLWTKGETSGNFLDIVSMNVDCDKDTIIIMVKPHGPACHTGTTTCFDNSEPLILNDKLVAPIKFTINTLEKIIHQRIDDKMEGSYTYSLIQKGINKVAQKVGEEAVETVIDAINGKEEDFLYEAADLMYHYLVLLKAKGFALENIEAELAKRH